MQPTTRCDAVGNVGELVGSEDGDEVLEDSGLDQVGVQLGYTVDLVGTDAGKVCHTDHLGVRFFDDRDSAKHVAVLGEIALHILHELQIDVVDDLEMARKKVLHERD